MELTAGLGSVDDYIRYIEAGADECFCGYIPYAWDRKYGTVLSLNRREVRCCSVQLGAFSELEILAAMVRAYQKPVQLTFNSLYYLPQQYPEIAEIIQKCMKIGFEDYIIADPALILYLRQQKIGCRISLSGEVGEINSAMTGLFEQMEISRIIFPRKMRPKDMAVVAQACAKRSPGLENMKYEAFALNELCQFSGAFCNSLHCDEMGYLCRVPGRCREEPAEGQHPYRSQRMGRYRVFKGIYLRGQTVRRHMGFTGIRFRCSNPGRKWLWAVCAL